LNFQQLQNILKHLGYLTNSFLPGELDEHTRAGIRLFQSLHRLEPTGEADDSMMEHALRALEGREFVVFGQVVDADGPLPEIRVEVQDRDLGAPPWQRLGEDVSDRDGRFVIRYTFDQFATGDRIVGDRMAVPDLVFSLGVPEPGMRNFRLLRMPGEQPLGEDDIELGLQARPVEEIKILVELSRRRRIDGASEYERLLAAFRAVWPERAPGSLEEIGLREITFAARELDESFPKIQALVNAFRWAEGVFRFDLTPEVLYGLARSRRQLTSLEKLGAVGETDLKEGLSQAIDDRIIPQLSSDQIRSAIRLILRTAPSIAATHPVIEGLPTFAERIAAAVPEDAAQSALLSTFAESRGDSADFWRQLRAKPEFADAGKVERAQFALQLDALTQTHLPLMNVLQSEHGLASTRDLLQFGEHNLRNTLARADVGVPRDVPGANDAERLENYLTSVMGALRLALPTESVAMTMRTAPAEDFGGDSVRDAVGAFFANATTQAAREAGAHFDIRTSSLDDYLANHGDSVFGGVTAEDRAKAVPHIARAQRLFRVSTDPASFEVLRASVFQSARDIASMPQQAFVERFQDSVGPQQAMMMHSHATAISASSVQLYVTLNDAFRGANPDAVGVGDPDGLRDMVAKHIPNWQELFSAPELCACAHCRSVYSPAAYLVDILHFLEKSRANAERLTPLDILIGKSAPGATVMGRRPDLAHLQLTCENTNTAIPYVDLVNEVLESLALSWATVEEKDGRIIADTNAIAARDTGSATTPELKASPQYVLGEAYRTPDAAGARARLDRVAWPLSLPYDEPLETIRVYLQYLGVSSAELIERFGSPGEPVRYLAESLRISPNEFAILTGTNLDGTPAAPALRTDDLYGFTPELLPRLAAGAAGLHVAALKQKLNTGGAGLPLGADLEAEAFDAATTAAVAALQAANGSAPTGVVAIGEWRSLHDVDPDIAGLFLPNVREFLRRTGLNFEELVSLCEMRFLNPEREVFAILERLRIPQAELSAWIAAGFAGAPGPGITAALAEADVPLAEFTAWATTHLRDEAWDRVKASLVLEAPMDDPCNLDRTRLRHWNADRPALEPAESLRLNRIIRLWRKLGWTLGDLDRTLVALGASEITPEVIQQLALVQRAQIDLDLPVDQVAMLWAGPDTTSDDSFFHRRFLSKAALRNDPAFAPDWKGSMLDGAKISEHVPAILSGLRLKADHLDAIRADALPAGSDDLTLENLGKIAGYAILSRALDMRPRDFVILRQLSGIDPFTKPAPAGWSLQLFTRLARLVQDSDFSIAQLDYLFRGGAESPHAPDPEAVDRALQELGKELAQLAEEHSLVDDPRGEITRARLSAIYSDAELATRFVQMIDGSAIYAAPLAAIPNDVVWPAAFTRRFSFNVQAHALVCQGALTEAERVALRGLSGSAPFRAAIDAIAAAPRKVVADLVAAVGAIPTTIPAPEAKLLDISSFNAEGAPDAPAVAAKFSHVLKSVLPALHQAARSTFIKQKLAEALSLDPATLARLIERNQDGRILLHGIGAPADSMITDFFEPIQVANAKRAWLRLHKAALLIGAFKLSEAEVGLLAGKVFDFDQLPDAAPPVYNPAAFDACRQLIEYAALKRTLPPAATPLAALFGAGDLNSALKLLAESTGWAEDRLQFLAGAGAFAFNLADVQQAPALTQLQTSLKILDRMGVEPAQAFAWARQPVTPAVADDVKRAARALQDEPAWLGIAKKLNDPLREGRRDALIAYLLPRLGLENSDKLYEYLLIDVDMSACMMTSRVKQAASSVQLFIQRCLMNLEPRVAPSAIDHEQWKWMQRYRVWEANRKVFLYPENWIEPELRDDKTPYFAELESELLQNDVTDANVEKALLGYLEKLDSVAKLRMCGIFVQTDFEPGEKLKEVAHVFGRTLNTPYTYHYRRYVVDSNDAAYWTPWEKVPVDIRGDEIAPVIYNRRLYLFWYVVSTKAEDPPANSKSPTAPEKYSEIQVAWSEYVNGKWSPKFISDPERALRITLPNKRRFEANVSGEVLSVVYSVSEVHGISYKPGFDINGNPTPTRTVTEYIEKAEGRFEFDNCHGTLELKTSGWTKSYLNGFGVSGSAIQPLGNGLVEPLKTLTQTYDGARITEEHLRHPGTDYFLFEDNSRTYFAYMNAKWDGTSDHLFNPELVKPDLSKYGDILYKPYEVERDLGRPYFAETAKVAAASSNPWLSSTATLGVMSLQAKIPATMQVMNAPGLGSPAVAVSDKPAYTLITDYSKYTQASQGMVRYDIFYHPFTCEFIKGLRRYGVPGLLNLSNQQLSIIDTFDRRYLPNTAHVAKPYPVEQVDFGRVGATSTYRVTAYSTYNWEIFFHVPLLLATRLSENQRFEEAMRWYHYVFNPTDGAGGYWKALPFRTTPKERIDQLLTSLNAGNADAAKQVAEWRDHPFQPHLIARMRLIAYQKHVVMKYIDNLIAWADQLFRQDTIETINQATQLYILCAGLLGPRPQQIPARGEAAPATFAELRGKLDAFSNALVSFENKFPFYSASSVATAKDAAGLLGIGRSFYFCIPQNEKLLGYWDTVADRLFKIRHCRNIEGIVRELPLFEPPIDPALLVRAAARGVDLGSVLNDLNSPAPFYRFTHMLQKALEVCMEIKSLGAQFLMALEKRDAEHLALMRQQHESNILNMVRLTREKQIEDAEAAIEALRTQRKTMVNKYQHFRELLGAESGPAPAEGADIPFVSARKKIAAQGGAHLIDEESNELGSAHSARDWTVRNATTEILAGVLHYIPNIDLPVMPWGVGTKISVSVGGPHVGPAMGAVARYQKSQGEQASYNAATSKRMGEHTRREQQWVQESNQAAGEIMHIDKLIVGATIRLAIAKQELINHDRQISNAAATEEFLRTKYTNEELYGWMQGQTSELFFRSYQLAYDLAKKAERAFQFELGLTSSDFIRFGAWDSLRKGLLSGEQLSLQLRQLDRAWHDRNKREYEITKHVSLLQLDPQAFIRLKETGICEFEAPEAMFDLDFPGHYFRRLRSVSVSVPCVVGPYTSISATLTLLNHRMRTDPRATAAYPEKPGEDETRFRRDFVPMQSIATSSANNDSGVFELNFRDERYLPFEGAGAISRWRLQLPQRDSEHPEKSFAQFHYDTISDIVLHVKYTAREGGDALKARVTESLNQTLNALHEIGGEQGLARLFSLRHEFPNEWRRARQLGAPLIIEIPKDRFPFFVQSRKITVQAAFHASGPDEFKPLPDPEFVSAKNLWKLTVNPAADVADMLIMFVYTIS
jgi:hypothetical protein